MVPRQRPRAGAGAGAATGGAADAPVESGEVRGLLELSVTVIMITRTTHREALIVKGTGYEVMRSRQARDLLEQAYRDLEVRSTPRPDASPRPPRRTGHRP